MERSTKNIMILGGVIAALGFVSYFFFKNRKSRVGNNQSVATNRIFPEAALPNSRAIGGSNYFAYSVDRYAKLVTVNLYVDGGDLQNNDVFSFALPVENPYNKVLSVPRVVNGIQTGEFRIDGNTCYVSGYGYGEIHYSYMDIDPNATEFSVIG